MSKLGIEQKSVKLLLGDNKADFLIPDVYSDSSDTLARIFRYTLPEKWIHLFGKSDTP